MCRKCLWRADGDEGIDWKPTQRGTGMFTGGPPQTKYLKDGTFASNSQGFNLNKIRFGNDQGDMTSWKKRPSYRDEPIEFEEDKYDYTTRQLEQLADQLLRAEARTVDPDSGKERGIGGENPILFDEHLYQRQKREILNENGVPEPGLVSGMYYRSHPEGRKVNSEEQRKKHGASYYR